MRFAALAVMALTLALGGCQKLYVAPAGKPQATLTVTSKNDSTRTTLRTLGVYKYANFACQADSNGVVLASKKFMKETWTTAPIKIPAGEAVVFATAYGDARFAQNRDCSVTASFVPEENHLYRASFDVVNESTACSLLLEDVTQEPAVRIKYEEPLLSCPVDMSGRRHRNGEPGGKNWSFTVVPGSNGAPIAIPR